MGVERKLDCRKRALNRSELIPRDLSTLLQLKQGVGMRRPPRTARLDSQRLRNIADLLAEVADPGHGVDVDRLVGEAEWLRAAVGVGAQYAAESAAPTDRAVLCAWLKEAAARGYTLEALAAPLGVTREAVRQMVVAAVDVPGLPPVSGPGTKIVDLPWPTLGMANWRRIVPVELTSDERVALIELHWLATQNRGNVGADDPRRLASEQFVVWLHELIDVRGMTYQYVADVLGVTRGAVRSFLMRHGYRKVPPSQKGYQGAARDQQAVEVA